MPPTTHPDLIDTDTIFITKIDSILSFFEINLKYFQTLKLI